MERVDSTPGFCYDKRNVGTSSNGKTADSGSAYRGSNPCVPASFLPALYFLKELCDPAPQSDWAEIFTARTGSSMWLYTVFRVAAQLRSCSRLYSFSPTKLLCSVRICER